MALNDTHLLNSILPHTEHIQNTLQKAPCPAAVSQTPLPASLEPHDFIFTLLIYGSFGSSKIRYTTNLTHCTYVSYFLEHHACEILHVNCMYGFYSLIYQVLYMFYEYTNIYLLFTFDRHLISVNF